MNEIQYGQTVAGQEMEEEYAYYIMANSEMPICNGDMLTEAMESGYLWQEFLYSLKGKK